MTGSVFKRIKFIFVELVGLVRLSEFGFRGASHQPTGGKPTDVPTVDTIMKATWGIPGAPWPRRGVVSH